MSCSKVLTQHSYGETKERHENLDWESPGNPSRIESGTSRMFKCMAEKCNIRNSTIAASFYSLSVSGVRIISLDAL
jgi:hypothetical protein